MAELDREDEYANLGRPKLFTKGKIGTFYPTNKVNKLLTFKDEMNTIAAEPIENNNKESA